MMIERTTHQEDAMDSQGYWTPANGGSETPFTSKSGMVLQYMWNPTTKEHAYMNCGNDTILTNEEADAAMADRNPHQGVPHVTVCKETAYGHTTTLSFGIRVF